MVMIADWTKSTYVQHKEIEISANGKRLAVLPCNPADDYSVTARCLAGDARFADVAYHPPLSTP